MSDLTATQDWRTVIDGQLVTLATKSETLYDHYAQATGLHVTASLDPVSLTNTQNWSTYTVYYKMRGMDNTVNGLYDIWVVNTTPDFTASAYTGALNRPLRDVCIIDFWQI